MCKEVSFFSWFPSLANADFLRQGSSWQSPKVKNGPYVAKHLGKGLQKDPSQIVHSFPLTFRECSDFSEPYADTYYEAHDQNKIC